MPEPLRTPLAGHSAAIADQLREATVVLREETARQIAGRTPAQPPTAAQVDALRQDLEAFLAGLGAALRAGDAAPLVSVAREGVERSAPERVRIALETLGQTIREQIGEEAWLAVQPHLDAALAWLCAQSGATIALPGSGELLRPGDLARAFMHTSLQGDRLTAQQLVFDALDRGLTIRDIYLQVFQPSLYEIGRLWEIGRVSIAQEHLATAITQAVLSAIYARVPLETPFERQAIVACLAGNYHDIGPRMVADFLQMAGFNTRFLGANTPQEDLLQTIQAVRPEVIGLSATTAEQVSAVQRAIAQVRADFASYRPTVMVGGLAFNAVEGLWRQVQADVWGEDAGLAVDRLVGSAEGR